MSDYPTNRELIIGADLSKSYGTDGEIHSTRLRLKGRKRPSLYGYWDCNNVYTDGVQLTEPTNNKRTLAGGVALGAAVAVILLTFFQIHYIGGSGDGDLLWNTKEAYLFVRGERRGYHVSYLGYLGELVIEYFGVIDPPDDENPFTLVIRITPAGTERYEVKGEYHYFTPLDDILYAGHNDQYLWKWIGTHFEKASIEEQRRLNGIQRLSKKEFTDVNGWSGRYSVTSKIKEQFPLLLSRAPMTVEVTTLNLADGEVSVDLLRPDHPPETIFRRNGRPHRVSRSEYEHTFAGPN